MQEPVVVILDEEEQQQVGIQIKGILDQTRSFHVDIMSELVKDVRSVNDTAAQLLIPVFPPAIEQAETLRTALRSVKPDIPLLPVLRPQALTEGFDKRLLSAHDFLVTPLRDEEVRFRVARLTQEKSRETLKAEVSDACGLAQLIGADSAFVALKRKIQLAARFESTVLLTGETGTGKERCARALHYLSPRAGKPFIPVNCGAIPVDLFENELYGHIKGAFTGAYSGHAGLIAEAEGGTLFLDEIETLSLSSQVKLLRFLQDHSYYAVGSSRARQAKVWIIASTNVELPLRIREGSFREDLFYRLAVINLVVPPLRERKGDIPMLASYFWALYAPRAGRSDHSLSREVMDALGQHTWPGNVRELENVVHQLAVLTESLVVRPEDLPLPRAESAASKGDSFTRKKAAAIEEFERSYVTQLLREHNGNVTQAAREAKKDRRSFGRLIKKYRIAKP